MGKVALITGASSGIGKELAYIHAQSKGDLILVARREKELNEIKEDLVANNAVNVHVITADLSIQDEAQVLYKKIQSLRVEVDYLFNNAGFGQIGRFDKLPWARQRQMINLNVMALTELTHLFLPQMIARKSGKILNTSSTASLIPGPLQAVYYATKAYVTSFSNALSEELVGTGVTVTNLMPGATETGFGADSGMDKTPMFQKTASAKSVAQDGYNAMLKGKLDVISGLTSSQKLMMAFVPLTPKKVLLKQVKSMQTVK